jgi:hypothetical protein
MTLNAKFLPACAHDSRRFIGQRPKSTAVVLSLAFWLLLLGGSNLAWPQPAPAEPGVVRDEQAEEEPATDDLENDEAKDADGEAELPDVNETTELYQQSPGDTDPEQLDTDPAEVLEEQLN